MSSKRLLSIKFPERLRYISILGIAIFAILITISPPLTQPASAAIVQQNSTTCTNSGGGTTVSCTVTTPTDGNTMIAVIAA